MNRLTSRDSQLVNATETISSVAHCLRELVENSFDAGSTIINIKLTGSGLDTIVINDNGCGISREGLMLLCNEGATSKKLGGKMSGGRGKALEAISSLSFISVESCVSGSQTGYRLYFNEEGERIIQSVARPKGTCITVQSLFHNYPVRRKYCIEHKQQTIQEIQEVCASFAIATNASITVILDNKTIIQVSNYNRQQRIKSVLGAGIAQGLITGKSKLDDWSESAFLEYFTSSPTTASNGRIFLIINNRPAINLPLVRALRQEFKLCAGPKMPTIILYISADRECYDFFPESPLIGVTFSREEILQRLLCNVLGEAWKTTSETLTFQEKNGFSKHGSEVNVNESPASLESPLKIKSSNDLTVVKSVHESRSKIDDIMRRRRDINNFKPDFGPSHNIIETESFGQMEVIGQWNKAFLVTKLGSDIYAIDQHAAWEAQNFEKLRKQTTKKRQKLLNPVILKATPEDLENAQKYKDECLKFGFEYDVFEDGIHVTTIPSDKNVVNGLEDLQELLGMIHEVPFSTPMTRNARIQLAYHACHSSVRVGDTLSHQQIKKLLKTMSQSDYPWNCPHGRPTWCCIHVLESESNPQKQNSNVINADILNLQLNTTNQEIIA